ncbi:MAG TPA: hypothetical protein VFI28_05415 [Candidatus Limnocylindrales bacterium]|nr:hypothetical protein [Candidatus Limnocylindrales bacterium]
MGETHKTAEDTEGQGHGSPRAIPADDTEGQGHGTPRALPDDEGAGPSGNSQFR